MGLLEALQRRIHVPRRDEWPPKDVRERWEKVQEWRRRYENDRDELLMFNPTFNQASDKAELYTPVNMTKEICRLSSSLLFSAPPQITHSSYEEELGRFLKVNGFDPFLQETGEQIAYAGRGAFRVGFHPDVEDGEFPNVTFIPDDRIIWHRWDRFMIGGTVVIEHEPDASTQRTYRLLEHHARGAIKRELYEGTESTLGTKIGFDEKIVEELFPDYVDMPEEVETGLKVPTLVEWSNVPGSFSDVAGNEVMLDRYDEAESLLLDKGRKSTPVTVADESMVEGTSFSAPGIVFLKSAGYLPADGNPYVETIQPGFDVTSHLDWIEHIRNTILLTSGYSIASWGLDDGGQASGKALKLKQARTLLHRAGKDKMAIEAIKTCVAVSLAYLNKAYEIEDFKPEIKLGDGLPEDPIENAQQIQLEDSVGAISHAEKLRVIRPQWTEERVQEEVEAKKKEDEEAMAAEQDMAMAQAKANADARAASTPGTQPRADGKNPKPRGTSGDSTSGPARKDQL